MNVKLQTFLIFESPLLIKNIKYRKTIKVESLQIRSKVNKSNNLDCRFGTHLIVKVPRPGDNEGTF